MGDVADFAVHDLVTLDGPNLQGFLVMCKVCGMDVTADVDAIGIPELLARIDAHVCPPVDA